MKHKLIKYFEFEFWINTMIFDLQKNKKNDRVILLFLHLHQAIACD